VRVGGAVGGALRLIARRPFSVLAWGLFTTLVGFAPIAVILNRILPADEAAAQVSAQVATGSGPAGAGASLFAPTLAAYALAGLLAIVTLAVVDAAIYRAVLEPDNRGAFSLKLRRRELSLVVLHGVQALLWSVLIVAAAIPAAWIIGVTANTVGRSWAVLVTLVAALIVGFVFGVMALRLSLAGPLTFDRNRISLATSWRATGDQFGAILAVAIIVCLILWLWTYLGLVVAHIVLDGAAFDLIASLRDGQWIVLTGLLSLYFGVCRVLIAAPAALICRQLASVNPR